MTPSPAGADGYVLKQIDSHALIHALERVGRGENLLDPTITGRVFAKMREVRRQERAHAFADLSAQEMRHPGSRGRGRDQP